MHCVYVEDLRSERKNSCSLLWFTFINGAYVVNAHGNKLILYNFAPLHIVNKIDTNVSYIHYNLLKSTVG